MRPTKHVTHSLNRAQDVFDISIARQRAHHGSVPLAVTSESDAITLFAWSAADNVWHDAQIPHAPIETPRGVPSISNTWNWSRRVGLASAGEFIYVVYKRAPPIRDEGINEPAVLMLDTFQVNAAGALSRVASFPVPMRTYRINEGIHFNPILFAEKPGFELWAGVNDGQLLIATQTLGRNATEDGDNADLTLFLGDLDRLDQVDGWTYETLDKGGYGLDVRLQGNVVTLAYRTLAASLSVPFPQTIDPFFSGWPHLETGPEVASDQFFTPLTIMSVSLPSLDTTKLDLPGGEHPRIQNLNPLMVVVDRPEWRVRFRTVPTTRTTSQARIDWDMLGIHKLTFVLDDQQRVARGVLMSFRQGDRPTFPRTAVPWVNAQDLYSGITRQGIGWASTWSRFPLEPLQLAPAAKGFVFDFVHKEPLFALQHSQVHLAADFQTNKLTVTDLKSEVWDINHEQILAPDTLRPDATGENAQFASFSPLGQQSNSPIQAPTYFADNTIGGSLITDRAAIPYQYFSYTDLGDSGLRVVFDADLGPPKEPVPPKKPKTLEPESVPGPGSGDEQWIELNPGDWEDAGVPTITLEDLLNQPTLTSANHCRIESLLEAGSTLAGLETDDENGWSEDEVNSIQTSLNDFFISLGPLTIPDVRFSDDGTVPRAFISILPATVVADATTTWEAGLEDETAGDVAWTFNNQTQPFPSTITVSGNPLRVALTRPGDWTVRADITRANGTSQTFQTVVTAEDSLFRKVASVHRGLSERGLDAPLSTIGNYRIGTATLKFLQYEIKFPVEPDELNTHRIVIKSLDQTAAQWRFQPNALRQGLIGYRLQINFESKDVRLTGLLNALLKIESVAATFFYGRTFTPGILMNDTRSVVPLTGEESSNDLLSHVPEERKPRRAAALTARPSGEGRVNVTKDMIDVKVSMLAQAAAAGVVTLLIGLGAVAAATTLLFLMAALTAAVAAAMVPLAGALAVAAVVAASVAIFLFITFAVPPMVEGAIKDSIRRGIESADSVKGLEDARFLQFAGEGLAETIARQVIGKANEAGASFEAPHTSATEIGQDRFRENVYQMIHVSDGRCRVLVRM